MRHPNLACMLCNQYSDVPVCTFCKFDTRFLLQLNYHGNLLRYPAISQQFRHTGYSCLRACGEYVWPFDTLIHNTKFKRCLISPSILAEWFVEMCLDDDTLLPDCLLPVPIQLRRFIRRQFNQSTEIARHIGKAIQRPVKPDWATRTGGKTQSGLSRADRLLNLRQAFTVTAPEDVHHVAIIDDVMTTGTTADVLARQLRAHNPDLIVEVWAIAITLRKPLVRTTL